MEANTISVANCKHGYLPKHQGELVHISLIPNLGDFFISFTAFGWHINFGHCICTLYQLQRYCYMYINLTCCHGCFCTCFEIFNCISYYMTNNNQPHTLFKPHQNSKLRKKRSYKFHKSGWGFLKWSSLLNTQFVC